MRRVNLKHIPIEPNPFSGWGTRVHRIFFGLMLVSAGLVGARLVNVPICDADARWPEGVFIVFAAASTLASLARELPVQNVMLAFVVIMLIAGGIGTAGAMAGVPFGPIRYTDRIGQELFHPLPWSIPLLWLVLVLNARGTARLLLRRWRHSATYGYWIMGVATLLVLAFDFGFEPVATHVIQYWTWQRSKTSLAWYGAPWTNFAGWIVTTLLILAFALPALINKKPGNYPPAWHPLVVWSILHVLVAIAAFAGGFSGLGIYLVIVAAACCIVALGLNAKA
jgi:uncharacterized membrane protein